MDITVSIAIACAKYKKRKSELAEFLGVKPQTISNWLSKKTAPTTFQLEMMAAFFGITVIEFISLGEVK